MIKLDDSLRINKNLKTEFSIVLALDPCFRQLNDIFKENNINIELKLISGILHSTSENHDSEIPLKAE